MKAVVLAGGQEFGQCTLSRRMPRALWPVLDRPIIEHVLAALRNAGVGELSISANGQTQRLADALASRSPLDIAIHYSEDTLPRGAAGCIKDCQPWLGDETFLVVHGASLLLHVDFPHLLREHRQANAALSIATASSPHDSEPQPAGIYVCEKSIFPYIAPRGYQDMKEQLIPRLAEAGLIVQAVHLRGRVLSILNEESYLNAVIDLLDHEHCRRPLTTSLLGTPTLWIDRSASLHPTARVVGPAYIGPNTIIGADTLIVGPAQLGPNCRIDAEAVIHESILWDNAHVGSAAIVEQSILATAATVPSSEEIRGRIVLDRELAPTPLDASDPTHQPAARATQLWQRLLRGLRVNADESPSRRSTRPGLITP